MRKSRRAHAMFLFLICVVNRYEPFRVKIKATIWYNDFPAFGVERSGTEKAGKSAVQAESFSGFVKKSV